MRPRLAVVDTNVVVAALITSRADSPTSLILDGMLAASFPYLLSTELVAEYLEVLSRPRISDLHGLSPKQLDIILTTIVANGIYKTPVSPASAAPDPGDDHLWALAQSEPDCVLVTGDRLLVDSPPGGVSVISPREFLER
jgi:uncharacterized protein